MIFHPAPKKLWSMQDILRKNREDLQVSLLHVSPDPIPDSVDEEFESLQEKYSRTFRQPLRLIKVQGKLAASIVETQSAENFDLIIMGTSGVEDVDEDSNAAKLVLLADCPVMTVPESYKIKPLRKISLVLGKDIIDDSKPLSKLLAVARRFNAKVHVLTIEKREFYRILQKSKRKMRIPCRIISNGFMKNTLMH